MMHVSHSFVYDSRALQQNPNRVARGPLLPKCPPKHRLPILLLAHLQPSKQRAKAPSLPQSPTHAPKFANVAFAAINFTTNRSSKLNRPNFSHFSISSRHRRSSSLEAASFPAVIQISTASS